MQENQTYLNFTGNLSNSTYSSDLKSFVTIITITTSSFSLLGCSAIIFLYIAFNSLQQFNFQLVFYLSISILITAIGTLTVTSNDANIGGNDRTYCVLQSFLINFGGLSTIYWNMIIIYYMNALLKSANEAYVMSQKLVLFFGISLPLVLSIM